MAVDPSNSASLSHNIDVVLSKDPEGDATMVHWYRHLLFHCRQHFVAREARIAALQAAVDLFRGESAGVADVLDAAKKFEAYLVEEG